MLPTPHPLRGLGPPILTALEGEDSPSGPACPRDLVGQRSLGAQGGQEHHHCLGDQGHQ